MKIDAHQHFWRYDPAQYPWIPEGSPLHRDWLPADLAALQQPLGIDGRKQISLGGIGLYYSGKILVHPTYSTGMKAIRGMKNDLFLISKIPLIHHIPVNCLSSTLTTASRLIGP